MLSFDNTEIAFAGKTDKDLQWSYRLFNVIGKPWLVKLGNWMQKIAFAIRLPIRPFVKRTIFKQFCGGETVQECEVKIKELGEFNVGTILDYSVEGMESNMELDRTRDEIIATIYVARDNPNIPFAVFKPTGICNTKLLRKANEGEEHLHDVELKEWEKTRQRVDDICSAAHETGVPVFVDAEDSWFQDAIDRMVERMMEKYNKEKAIVYHTIQMYRHDRFQYLKDLHADAKKKGYILGVKLVRGAYMEKEREKAKHEGYPSPIQPNKKTTDLDYNEALSYMIKNIEDIWFCAGTHNEYSCALVIRMIEEYELEKNDHRIWFAQLLGMSDHISFNLAHHGYNVAKYVPYGPVRKVMPYLMRRAQENTSVAGQVGRELGLIIKEKKRRKNISD